MLLVVSYDIVDDKRRAKVAEILKDYGKRVQYSVFECELGEKVLRKMLKEIIGFIKVEEDSIRVYRLCRDCQNKLETYGIGPPHKNEEGPIVI